MEKNEFLEKHVFVDLKNTNDGFNSDEIHHFSETDFGILLKRAAKFGIGIYKIEPWLNGKVFGSKTNEDYNKTATNSKWYISAFSDFKREESDLQYSATFKLSEKLLNKENLNF